MSNLNAGQKLINLLNSRMGRYHYGWDDKTITTWANESEKSFTNIDSNQRVRIIKFLKSQKGKDTILYTTWED